MFEAETRAKQREAANVVGSLLVEADAAKSFGVGHNAVRDAAGLKAKAPEVFAAVKAGKISAGTPLPVARDAALRPRRAALGPS